MHIEIEAEFEGLLPKQSKENNDGLRNLIKADGKILYPVVVWETSEGRNILLDGHRRHDIAKELGFELPVKTMKFASRDDAIAWAIEHQKTRRNMTEEQIRECEEEAIKRRGRRYNEQKKERGGNQAAKRGAKGQIDPLVASATAGPVSGAESTADRIAKEEGVSPKTVKRDAARMEMHDAIEENDPETAKDVLRLPQSEVDKIRKDTKSVPAEEKPAVVAEKVKGKVAKERDKPVVIEGACKELCELVQSGQVSEDVAKNLVEKYPGQVAQAKIVSQGAAKVKSASAKPREEAKKKEPPKVTEKQVLAFFQDADEDTKRRIATKIFGSSEADGRNEILRMFTRTMSETEKFKLIDWAREQSTNLESEMTAKEVSVISTRAKVSVNQKHRVALVKKLLDNPSPPLVTAMKKWSHEQFVGKSALFTPPTPEEVKEYAESLDPKKYPNAKSQKRIDKFFDYYEGRGWTFGDPPKPMSEWKAHYRKSLGWQAEEESEFEKTVSSEPTGVELTERARKSNEEYVAKYGETPLVRSRRLRAEAEAKKAEATGAK